MKENKRIPIGGSSLMVVITVLCLVVFATLSYSSAKANQRQSVALAESVKEYYALDQMAEEIFAEIRQGNMPSIVKKEGNIYKFKCNISDKRSLLVEIEDENNEYRINKWQLISNIKWETDDKIEVLNGD